MTPRVRSAALLAAAGVGAVLSAANPAWAVSYSVIYTFEGGADGAIPLSTLLNVGGTLYGTTGRGGSGCSSEGCGTVYSVTQTGAEHVVYRFEVRGDGRFPRSIPTNVDGTLYGTTEDGGHGAGIVYSVTTSGVETIIHKFRKRGGDGTYPFSRLQNVSGTLYGTTSNGGDMGCSPDGCGTVYSVTPAGVETIVHAFSGGSDGLSPLSGVLPVGTTLYGTTYNGGNPDCDAPAGCGTVYAIDSTGAETVIHAFGVTQYDGLYPQSGLVDVGGTLFGTTSGGGSAGCGTVYSISAGVENVIYSFKGNSNDGCKPTTTLLNAGGTLYGTTLEGGPSSDCAAGCGTLYSITTSGAETVLHFFGSTNGDGQGPAGALVNVNGTLFGTTSSGGRGYGTVYKIRP